MSLKELAKKPVSKTGVLVALAVVLLVSLWILGYNLQEQESVSETIIAEQYMPVQEPQAILPSELRQAFVNNAENAEIKYKEVFISGQIYEVMESVLSSIDVVFETDDLYTFVKGNTPNIAIEKVSNLRAGDYVTLKCVNARWDKYEVNVLLSHCEVQ